MKLVAFFRRYPKWVVLVGVGVTVVAALGYLVNISYLTDTCTYNYQGFCSSDVGWNTYTVHWIVLGLFLLGILLLLTVSRRQLKWVVGWSVGLILVAIISLLADVSYLAGICSESDKGFCALDMPWNAVNAQWISASLFFAGFVGVVVSAVVVVRRWICKRRV